MGGWRARRFPVYPLAPGRGRVAARPRRRDDQNAGGHRGVVDDVALRLGVETHEGPRRGRVLLPVDHDGREALEREKALLLVALDLVVLRDPLAGLEARDVQPERREPERLAGEAPRRPGALEVVDGAGGV